MKKTFCDRCNKETEIVKHSEHAVEDYEKSDGSGKGPRLVLDVILDKFDDKGSAPKPEFCDPCFEQIVIDFLVAKKTKSPESAPTSTEEDIPF